MVYLAADVITQCLFLTGAGYLCAIVILTALGPMLGSFSLVTSWRSEPYWYGVALLVTYSPRLWVG